MTFVLNGPELPSPGRGHWGPLLELGLGVGHDDGRLVAGPLTMGSVRTSSFLPL